MNRVVVVGVIFLFIASSVIPISGFNLVQSSIISTSGNTLYVGGSGPNNYTSIQDAIDNASDGDTIYVYDDSSPYYENIKIGKTIHLIGENRDTTVIDGSGRNDVVYISADEVIISKFTIQNSGDLGWQNDHDAGIDISSKYCIISDNLLLHNYYGIVSIDGCNNTLSYNTLIHNDDFGIILWDDGDDNIFNNTISANYDGILVSSCSKHNNVSNNVLDSNNRFGIAVTSNYNTVSKNNLCNNGFYFEASTNDIYENIVNGKPLIYLEKESNKYIEEQAGQIILIKSDNITIQNQEIDNTYVGIQLRYTSNCLISNCVLSNNRAAGIYLQDSNNNVISNTSLTLNSWLGAWIFFSCNNTFFGNTIAKNKIYGLWLHGSSDKTIISNNIIEKNMGGGISLSEYDRSGYDDICPNNNVISGNNIIQNDYGITLSSSSNNTIYHNTLINNIQNAYDFCNNIWDNGYPSGGNYWDDYNGTDANGDGIGDTSYPIPSGNNEDRYPLMAPHIIKNTTLEIGHIYPGLFKISTVIKNIGEYTALKVNWSITLDGGTILIGKETTGKISYIPAGVLQTVCSKLIIGFGQSQIIITADALNAEKVTKIIDGFIFLILVIIR